jgi:diguanylate cyclase (GGDEF)-like protein
VIRRSSIRLQQLREQIVRAESELCALRAAIDELRSHSQFIEMEAARHEVSLLKESGRITRALLDSAQADLVEARTASRTDALTGLPNRNSLWTGLEHALAVARRGKGRVAVLFVDIDDFKAVNDSYGHLVGDMLLRQMALRLQSSLRESDTICRFGGDEFVIVLEDLPEMDLPEMDLRTVISKIQGSASLPMTLPVGTFALRLSVGSAIYPDDGSDAATLIRMADASMYRDKDLGRTGSR